MTLLEICLDDIDGAITAERRGADRIELCAGLVEGGTTPSLGTVQTLLGHVERIGVQVLVRQRAGDFVFSATEVDAMCADIEAMRALPTPTGVRLGFVIGALNPDGTVDRDATRRMLAACGDAPVTFHKAFDETIDLDEALDILIELGIGRVLTSGGPGTAADGASALARLVRRSAGRIAILAAGGIRPHTAADLIVRTGVGEVHLRAQEAIQSGRREDTATRLVTSATVIDDMLRALGR
ncbi:copper homeostasis protein CutC [Agromyces ramosus]|uniref:PF03932 family protein CutC n=1 Tax=Agromyces ramosus TaxID=33879 RepID=A0ABU0RCW1_9MICO|nr:copper homeostasis protein CutC [Agromyces ramosus]MDQ0895091.1 copper homeostasis protein [Agromyces ramosus]